MKRYPEVFTKWNMCLVLGLLALASFVIWMWPKRVAFVVFNDIDEKQMQPNETSVTTHVSRPYRIKRHRFTVKQREFIAFRNDFRCVMCSRAFAHDLKDMDIDHIRPLAFGGADWPHLHNLQPLCVICHRRKTVQERR